VLLRELCCQGEVYNGAGNYVEEICYDTIFGAAGDGNRVCSGTNKVLGLSGSTNAHGEDPSLSNYATSICYGDLSCTARTGACLSGESLVLSLSSSTNAHLSSSSSYSQNICCSIGGAPSNGTHAECVSNTCTEVAGAGDDTCAVIGGSCDASEPKHAICIGQTCGIEIGAGTNECSTDAQCSGEAIAHSECIDNMCVEVAGDGIYECGVIGDTCTIPDPVHAICLGKACWLEAGDGTEECLDSTSCSDESDAHSECVSNTCVEVAGAGVNECGVIGTSCDVTPDPGSCSLTSASWSKSEVLERIIVEMIVNGTNCDGASINFFIAEADCIGTCNYGDIDLEDTGELSVSQVIGSFSGTQAIVSWTAEWVKDDNNGLFGDDDPEYVFKAELSSDFGVNIDESGELKVTPLPITYCDFVVLCGSYYNDVSGNPTAENACNSDVCDVADFSIETKEGDDFCDEGDISCFCEWDTSESLCESIWEIKSPPSPAGEAGRCEYTETTTGSCEDGFLTSSWNATWTGSGINSDCVDGQKIIECPAQIQLAFFNLYNMLITLLAIAGIYGILSLRKKL